MRLVTEILQVIKGGNEAIYSPVTVIADVITAENCTSTTLAFTVP